MTTQPHGSWSAGAYTPEPAGVEVPAEERPRKRDLFAILDGVPANLMIVLGLFLLLIGLTVPGCRRAYAESVEGEWRLAEALTEHDLAQFRRRQEQQRQAERDQAARNPNAVIDVSANEAARAAQLIGEETRLEEVHEVADKRREALEAAAAVQGMWAHRGVEWLGRLLLLLGLIITTSQASGLRQKVFVVLTVIVLLTSISGVAFDVDLGSSVRTDGAEDRPVELPRPSTYGTE